MWDIHLLHEIPFPIVYANWSLVFLSVNNFYWPRTALSSVLVIIRGYSLARRFG